MKIRRIHQGRPLPSRARGYRYVRVGLPAAFWRTMEFCGYPVAPLMSDKAKAEMMKHNAICADLKMVEL